MGLNIKSDRVHELARQLAEATGDNMTKAIEHALEAQLDRLRTVRGREAGERLRRIREVTARLEPAPAGVTSDHSFLYDENGVPQ